MYTYIVLYKNTKYRSIDRHEEAKFYIRPNFIRDKFLLIDCCLTSSNTLTSDLFNIFTWYFLIS